MRYLFGILLFLSHILKDFTSLADLESEVNKFSQHLNSISMHSLGVDVLQNHLNSITNIQDDNKDITQVMNQVVDKFNDRLSIAENALKSVKKFLEKNAELNGDAVSQQTEAFDCCGYKRNLNWDSLFQADVNLNQFCEISPYRNHSMCPRTNARQANTLNRLTQATTINFLAKLEDVYRDSQKLVHYIYYGRKDGYYIQYPAQNNMDPANPCACAKHDPRFRPWYVSAITPPLGKDVIIALDLSIDMETLRSNMAKIFSVLIDSLDGKDRVLVLFFGQDHQASQYRHSGSMDCLKTLSYTTPATIKTLKQYVGGVEFSGKLRYVTMFNESFDAYDRDTGKRLLYIITSGQYIDVKDEIIQTLTTKSKDSNCSVVLNMFLVTRGSFNRIKRETHTDMTKSVCSCDWCSGRMLGKFMEFDTLPISLSDIEKIISDVGEMNSNIFNTDEEIHITYTLPYKASHTSGTHLHACTRCNKNNNEIFGVVCVSFFSNELFGVDMQQNEDTYVFLIDRSGKTYVHPKYAEPVRSGIEPFPLDIRNLETSTGFEKIYQSMIERRSGRKTVTVNISIPTYKGQARFVEREYTYLWRPVDKSPFSLAVVQSSNRKSMRYNTPTKTKKQMYHRLDLYDNITNACLIRDSIAMSGISAIKLPREAFEKPVTYYEDETKESIQKLMDYFEMKPNALPPTPPLVTAKLAKKLRDSVVATSILDKEVWLNDSSVDNVYSLGRYVGTEDGVFRTYPAHNLNPYYDPRVRPWYVQAKANPHILTLTTPYEDAFTKTTVLTLTKTVIKRNTVGSEILAGVMGIDLSLPYIESLLSKYVTQCFKLVCVLIDESGYIIFHSEFNKEDAKVKYHLVEKERQVSDHLIQSGIMRSQHCVGYFKNIAKDEVPTAYIKKYYIVQPNTGTFKHKLSCRDYTLAPVTGTNMMLLIINNTCSRNDAECTCPHDVRQTCSNTTLCQQLCSCYEYKICLSDLPPLDSTLICDEKVDADVSSNNSWLDETTRQKLPECFEARCGRSVTDLQCDRLGCKWCFTYADGVNDTTKKCFPENSCPIAPLTVAKGDSTSSSLSGGAIAGIVIAVVVVLIVIPVVIAYFYFKADKLDDRPPRPDVGHDNRGVDMHEVQPPPVKDEEKLPNGWMDLRVLSSPK